MFSEAKPEVLKQECRVEKAVCIREFHGQTQSTCMVTGHTNIGYETSRSAQAKLHEELAQRDRALCETHIRSVHDVKEMRIDEFFRKDLRESWASTHELSPHMQELEEK